MIISAASVWRRGRRDSRIVTGVRRLTTVRTFHGWKGVDPAGLRWTWLPTTVDCCCAEARKPVELIRSRTYKSNAKAWVEQKNGMLIGRVVGHRMPALCSPVPG